MTPEPYAQPAPEGCFLKIAYEDDDLLILDKASGVPSVPHQEHEIHTAVNAALRILPDFGLDVGCLDRPIDLLSTGERQRLALMRALVDDPDVLLLDEPTGALDGERRTLVETIIRARLDAGKHVLLVSHDPDQIERLSDARLQLGPTARPIAASAATSS